MASDNTEDIPIMVSQGGVWRSNGAYREQFDVSALGIAATNAADTPEVAAAAD